MSCKEIVGDSDKTIIETVVAGIVTTDEQNRRANRIEGVERAQWPASDLCPEFAHVRKL